MEQTGFQIVPCRECGAKNRIPGQKAGLSAKCGRCGASLAQAFDQEEHPLEYYKIRCTKCRAKNRIPSDRLDGRPRCGKCGTDLETGALLISSTMPVSDADFEKTVLKSPLPVYLDCWAPWCGVCRMTMPVVDELARQWKGKVRVCRLNVDENPMVSSSFQITSTPTGLIFENGQLKDTLIGAVPKHVILQKIAPYL